MTNDGAPTMEAVSDLQERLDKLRATLAEKQAEASSRDDEIAQAYAVGDAERAEALSQEQAAAQASVRGLSSAIAQIEQQITADRERALEAEAKHRLVDISRAHGSVRSNLEKDMQRVARAADVFKRVVQMVNDRYDALKILETEWLFLVDRFENLDPTRLPVVQPPALHEAMVTAYGSVVNAHGAGAVRLPNKLIDLIREREVENLKARIAGTPTAEILEQAGNRPPGDTRSFEDRKRQATEANRQREEQQSAQARNKVDQWLRDQLANGPVLRDQVVKAAREAGITLSGPFETTLNAARERVGVIGAEREDDGSRAFYWALPNEMPDGFRNYRSPQSNLAMAGFW